MLYKLNNLKPNLESENRPSILDFSGSTCARLLIFFKHLRNPQKKHSKMRLKCFSSKAKIKLFQPFFYIEL